MSLTKRGDVYWFDFKFRRERYQRSTKQGDRKAARQMEAAFRTALAKGEVGIFERKPAPALKDFAQRFMDFIQVRCAEKPQTVRFYAERLARLLAFEPLATAKLDRIDEALIESYVQQRSKQVSPSTVNRDLATARRLLRLAQEWRVIDRVPRIRLLPGERIREFVLSHERERLYLDMAPQPLKDVAVLILDSGIRVGEAMTLQWPDVHLAPANGARFGYLWVRAGKSKNARRNLSLTARVRAMLEARAAGNHSPWVFPGEGAHPYQVKSVYHQHVKVRNLLRLPKDFVVHSLRHTMLTRLGEAGADAFVIMRIAGHSSVTVSQRYVHPSPEALERAFERLAALNERAAGSLPAPARLGTLPEGGKEALVPTILTTV